MPELAASGTLLLLGAIRLNAVRTAKNITQIDHRQCKNEMGGSTIGNKYSLWNCNIIIKIGQEKRDGKQCAEKVMRKFVKKKTKSL